MKKYVSYYRVSTQKQGVSGLGLESQKQIVSKFINCKNNECLIAEFTEVESGKKNNRVELLKALEFAKQNNAILIVAKLDRLSRDAGFIMNLQSSGVKFIVCDMPELNTLTIGIFASLAQYERELISKRTRESLAVAKQKGVVLGTPTNLTSAGRVKSTETIKKKALENENNRRAKSFIQALESQKLTLREIASQLNSNGFKTSTGKEFTAIQVSRLQAK